MECKELCEYCNKSWYYGQEVVIRLLSDGGKLMRIAPIQVKVNYCPMCGRNLMGGK